MKKVLCKDFGGPSGCNTEIKVSNLEELRKKCGGHVTKEAVKGDRAHQFAIAHMVKIGKEGRAVLIKEFTEKFNKLPEV